MMWPIVLIALGLLSCVWWVWSMIYDPHHEGVAAAEVRLAGACAFVFLACGIALAVVPLLR